VERFGARYVALGRRRGLNAARNAGVAETRGDLVVFVDDDVAVRPGWLAALIAAAAELPDREVFTGPVRARLEDHRWPSCGREGPPITTLDLGVRDADARYAWGVNMALRRRALQRVGRFEESLHGAGDEQEWQERLARAGGPPARYVAAAAVDHRRAGEDARLRSLARAARARGRASRRFDRWRGQTPSTPRELLTLAACLGHVLRYRCPAGLVMAAHSAGRLQEALRERRRAGPTPAGADADRPGEDFLSGHSGTVGGWDALRRRLRDREIDARELLTGRRTRLVRAAACAPPQRRVLVLQIERAQWHALAAAARAELLRSRHHVTVQVAAPGDRGKFANLNALLAQHPASGYDWLLTVDDDIVLPRAFLDRLLFLAERFGLSLAQPAHRLISHAAWEITRRRPGSAVRETAFVEIGPVTAFAASTFGLVLPFPDLRMGWGLDLHWGALARREGWRCGVIDAVPIGHAAAPTASAYSREQAVTEARAFLRERPYLPAREAARTLATHRRW
jgi:GT2 family glycosyltransferase